VDSSRTGLAARVVECQRGKAKSREERELCVSGECKADTEQRLRYLAESLALDTPQIFQMHVGWTRATHAARGLPAAYLSDNLSCLQETLAQDLPEKVWLAARPSVEEARASLEAPMEPISTSLLSSSDQGPSNAALARRLLLAILEGRRQDALDLVLRSFDEGTSIPDLHQDLIARVQAEIGWLWQAGEIHAGEEHIGTRIIEEALTLLRAKLPRRQSVGRSVLIASVEGNLHDVGARIVADRFELEGWTVYFLGANVPAPDLVRSLVEFGAEALALSVGFGLSARAAAQTVSEIRAIPNRRVPVIVGGLLFDSIAGLWKTVGADAYASDPGEAVRIAERLVAAPVP
jgi:methanogenic corrinoid protein MtbC1